MSMADDLKRAGVVGTADATTTLRRIAIDSLQRRAGYMPKLLPDTVYMRKINDERPVTPGATTSQLYRMLLGDFQFSNTLPEWCYLVAKHGMRMPGELIPSMLNSDLVFPDWRELILLAMGSYARWIVAHHREENRWQWVIQTPLPRIEKIDDLMEEGAQQLIARYEISRDKLDFHRRLAGHKYFWTDELSELAIDYIDFVLRYKPFDGWRIDINRFHNAFAYKAPLKYHDRYYPYLNIINEKQANGKDISMITQYRSKLTRIITNDARGIQAQVRGNQA